MARKTKRRCDKCGYGEKKGIYDFCETRKTEPAIRCRRLPPSVKTNLYGYSIFPTMALDSWCYEFKEKDDAKT